jgi:hypothetical protein
MGKAHSIYGNLITYRQRQLVGKPHSHQGNLITCGKPHIGREKSKLVGKHNVGNPDESVKK